MILASILENVWWSALVFVGGAATALVFRPVISKYLGGKWNK